MTTRFEKGKASRFTRTRSLEKPDHWLFNRDAVGSNSRLSLNHSPSIIQPESLKSRIGNGEGPLFNVQLGVAAICRGCSQIIMKYRIELVAPIAVCYTSADSQYHAICAGHLAKSPGLPRLLHKFWFGEKDLIFARPIGVPEELEIGPFGNPSYGDFEQYELDFLFTTTMHPDDKWRVWSHYSMPDMVWISPHLSDTMAPPTITPHLFGKWMPEESSSRQKFLTPRTSDKDAWNRWNSEKLPFRVCSEQDESSVNLP